MLLLLVVVAAEAAKEPEVEQEVIAVLFLVNLAEAGLLLSLP
jgi:hypothetical protein